MYHFRRSKRQVLQDPVDGGMSPGQRRDVSAPHLVRGRREREGQLFLDPPALRVQLGPAAHRADVDGCRGSPERTHHAQGHSSDAGSGNFQAGGSRVSAGKR